MPHQPRGRGAIRNPTVVGRGGAGCRFGFARTVPQLTDTLHTSVFCHLRWPVAPGGPTSRQHDFKFCSQPPAAVSSSSARRRVLLHRRLHGDHAVSKSSTTPHDNCRVVVVVLGHHQQLIRRVALPASRWAFPSTPSRSQYPREQTASEVPREKF